MRPISDYCDTRDAFGRALRFFRSRFPLAPARRPPVLLQNSRVAERAHAVAKVGPPRLVTSFEFILSVRFNCESWAHTVRPKMFCVCQGGSPSELDICTMINLIRDGVTRNWNKTQLTC